MNMDIDVHNITSNMMWKAPLIADNESDCQFYIKWLKSLNSIKSIETFLNNVFITLEMSNGDFLHNVILLNSKVIFEKFLYEMTSEFEIVELNSLSSKSGDVFFKKIENSIMLFKEFGYVEIEMDSEGYEEILRHITLNENLKIIYEEFK